MCGEQYHPKYKRKYCVGLDRAVVDMINEEGDYPEDRLGDEAYNGEDVFMCKRCYKVWNKHPQNGKPFTGFTDYDRGLVDQE
jgi:hypothetical protein